MFQEALLLFWSWRQVWSYLIAQNYIYVLSLMHHLVSSSWITRATIYLGLCTLYYYTYFYILYQEDGIYILYFIKYTENQYILNAKFLILRIGYLILLETCSYCRTKYLTIFNGIFTSKCKFQFKWLRFLRIWYLCFWYSIQKEFVSAELINAF